MTLYCMACQSPQTFERNWLDESDACATCGAKGPWRRCDEPKHAWELNENDRRFVKSLKIAAD